LAGGCSSAEIDGDSDCNDSGFVLDLFAGREAGREGEGAFFFLFFAGGCFFLLVIGKPLPVATGWNADDDDITGENSTAQPILRSAQV
jgi:hypothetical protein